jgi:hypothetical protein
VSAAQNKSPSFYNSIISAVSELAETTACHDENIRLQVRDSSDALLAEITPVCDSCVRTAISRLLNIPGVRITVWRDPDAGDIRKV